MILHLASPLCIEVVSVMTIIALPETRLKCETAGCFEALSSRLQSTKELCCGLEQDGRVQWCLAFFLEECLKHLSTKIVTLLPMLASIAESNFEMSALVCAQTLCTDHCVCWCQICASHPLYASTHLQTPDGIDWKLTRVLHSFVITSCSHFNLCYFNLLFAPCSARHAPIRCYHPCRSLDPHKQTHYLFKKPNVHQALTAIALPWAMSMSPCYPSARPVLPSSLPLTPARFPNSPFLSHLALCALTQPPLPSFILAASPPLTPPHLCPPAPPSALPCSTSTHSSDCLGLGCDLGCCSCTLSFWGFGSFQG